MEQDDEKLQEKKSLENKEGNHTIVTMCERLEIPRMEKGTIKAREKRLIEFQGRKKKGCKRNL